MINSAAVTFSVQRRDSVIHTSILSLGSLPLGLLQNVEQRSLGHSVGPCWLSVSDGGACVRPSQAPHLSPPILPRRCPSVQSLLLFCKLICVMF